MHKPSVNVLERPQRWDDAFSLGNEILTEAKHRFAGSLNEVLNFHLGEGWNRERYEAVDHDSPAGERGWATLYEDTSHGYLYTSRERCRNLLTYMSINKCA